MSHDTHKADDNKPGSSLTSAVWFMIILAFLYISAVNFIDVMSHDDGGHVTEAHGTEHAAPAPHGEEAHDTHAPADHGHEADEHGHDEAHH